MAKTQKKRSIFARLRNNFIAGIVVLIPIGVTIYLTLFIIKISSIILPKELNPNHYLPYEIPIQHRTQESDLLHPMYRLRKIHPLI